MQQTFQHSLCNLILVLVLFSFYFSLLKIAAAEIRISNLYKNASYFSNSAIIYMNFHIK